MSLDRVALPGSAAGSTYLSKGTCRWEETAVTDNNAAQQIAAGYTSGGAAVDLGAVVIDNEADAAAQVRIPLATLNRHGLVAGATGTGKTKTLQLLAEQLSDAGVPVVLADIKGDLSGLAQPGAPGDRITERAAGTGDPWTPASCPVEYLSLG